MSENGTEQFEEFEEKRDELFAGLLEAYEAGYKRALEDIEKSGEKFTKDQIEGSDYIQECHYYYWDGRVLPLEFWLREQFAIDIETSDTDRSGGFAE